MPRREILIAFVLAVSLAGCSGEQPRPLNSGNLPGGGAPPAESQVSGGSVIEALSATGRHQTFLMALERAGLAIQLDRRDVYTVLAPTDAAFAELGPETRDWLFEEANRAKLVELVTNHLLRGWVPETALRQPDRSLRTIAGNGLGISFDRGIWIGPARVALPPAQADNGFVYAIDRVLLPL